LVGFFAAGDVTRRLLTLVRRQQIDGFIFKWLGLLSKLSSLAP
jgi:hypothetical protein